MAKMVKGAGGGNWSNLSTRVADSRYQRPVHPVYQGKLARFR